MQALGSIQSTIFLLLVTAIFVFAVVGLISSRRTSGRRSSGRS
jgi:CBS domain containing-hemolysin-like protein